jgi:hypothetical protein
MRGDEGQRAEGRDTLEKNQYQDAPGAGNEQHLADARDEGDAAQVALGR